MNIFKVPVHEDQKFRYVQTPRAEKEDPMRACALTTADMGLNLITLLIYSLNFLLNLEVKLF